MGNSSIVQLFLGKRTISSKNLFKYNKLLIKGINQHVMLQHMTVQLLKNRKLTQKGNKTIMLLLVTGTLV